MVDSCAPARLLKINQMVESRSEHLDHVFQALAHPARREILRRIAREERSITELAAPFSMSLEAVSKHIQVLERAGLDTRSREAQRRPVHLDAAALERLTEWIDRYRLDAERNYRRLDGQLATLTEEPLIES